MILRIEESSLVTIEESMSLTDLMLNMDWFMEYLVTHEMIVLKFGG